MRAVVAKRLRANTWGDMSRKGERLYIKLGKTVILSPTERRALYQKAKHFYKRGGI